MLLQKAIQTSILCRFPREILDNIVYEAAVTEPRGPVYNPLLFICQDLYEALLIHNPESSSLYARIFRAKFDLGAATRRFGDRVRRLSNLAEQLRIYCETLHFLRRRNIYAHDLEYHLMVAFIMMVESDGRNAVQLEHAGLAGFVDDVARTRLWNGAEVNAGWPEETTLNSLTLWLVWFTTTKERLEAESPQDRANMIAYVMPFAQLAFRYPAFHAPDNHYFFPLPEEYDNNNFPASVVHAHGRWPLYRNSSAIKNVVKHYGREFILSTPLISQAAKLIYFSRREVLPIRVPPHFPFNREHALALGQEFGATQEDVVEFNAHPQAKLVPQQNWDWEDNLSEEQRELDSRGSWHRDLKTSSAKWDNDWERWMHCYDLLAEPELKGVVYTFGILNGLWQGRLLVAPEGAYMNLVTTAQRPPTYLTNDPFITGRPIYMRLREHHCIEPQDPVPVGGVDDNYDDGITNGWLPPIQRQMEQQGTLTIQLVDSDHDYKYETYVEGQSNSHNPDTCGICQHRLEIEQEEEDRHKREVSASIRSGSTGSASPPPSSPVTHADFEEDFAQAGLALQDEEEDYVENTCSGITDIIFTGDTEDRHGRAWDFYRYYGRVRAWDGLIALVRVCVDPLGQDDLREGKMIIRGYIVAGQTFVGTWRYWTPDIHAFPLEGPIVLSKRDN